MDGTEFASKGSDRPLMRYKLDVEKLSDDQLVDLVEKTVKESGELQHNLSRFTFERLVEVDEKVRACIDELVRRGKIHLIKVPVETKSAGEKG
jgi:hypothetical protein